MPTPLLNSKTSFKIAVLLSSMSMGFGIFREFLIVALLGFTAKNDQLQLYLSIFYTIGLSIDAMRLSCLNLYTSITLNRILIVASLIAMPFTLCIGLTMSYATGGLDPLLLTITLLGSYLNLIAAILITYKQRNNVFLPAQMINILPNFILIPGILLCYYLAQTTLVLAIVMLVSIIPLCQCILLLLLPNLDETRPRKNALPLITSIAVFARHFLAMLGDQLYQVIARSAFYQHGTGYLSLFAMAVRIYAAARFIIVDSFIGARLATWEKMTDSQWGAQDNIMNKLLNFTTFSVLIAMTALLLSFISYRDIFYSALQMGMLMMIGFYFSTLVRIIYFKINREETNTSLVFRFASYELGFAAFAFVLTKEFASPILTLLWVGYIAKPFAQLLFLRKRYRGLAYELRD